MPISKSDGLNSCDMTEAKIPTDISKVSSKEPPIKRRSAPLSTAAAASPSDCCVTRFSKAFCKSIDLGPEAVAMYPV